jgi:UDP-glucose 4-epimerase
VRCFDRASSKIPCAPISDNRVDFFEGSFFSRADLEKVLSGCDICYHFISTSVPATSNANPAKDAQENIVGTLQLLDVAREAGVKKIIFPSSGGAIYGLLEVLPKIRTGVIATLERKESTNEQA